MKNILEKIDSLKKEIDKNRPLSEELVGRFNQKMRLEWNYNSNAIEGNSLNLGETRSLILNGITAKGKPFKDHIDIEGHNDAILAIEDVIKKKIPLTEVFIRELHKILLKESYYTSAKSLDGVLTKKKIEIGQYKTSPNHVQTKTGEMFYFASPEETPAKMNDLMNWLKQEEEKKVHPLIIATGFHYKFVRIHPFDDGNGRMGRILMNLILMKHGYLPAIIEMNLRDKYINSLEIADTTGSYSDLIEFIGESLIKSMNIMLKAINGESIENEDDLDKEIALFKSSFNKNKDFKELNKDVVKSVYNENIEPAFFYLLDKINKIKDVFMSFDFNIEIRSDDIFNTLTNKQSITTKDFNGMLENALLTTLEKGLSFHFNYNLNGFKKIESSRNYSISMNINLNKYNYSIYLNNNKKLEEKYSNLIEFNIIKEQINKMIQELLKNLKTK